MRKNGVIRYDNRGRRLPEGITQRKSGRYQIRITVDGKQIVKYATDLAKAKELLRTMQTEAEKGAVGLLENLTLDKWYDKWMLKYKKGKLKQRTWNNYTDYYRRHIHETRLGKMKLNAIRQIHLVSHYNELAEKADKPLSQATLTYINSMIGGCLQQAMVDGFINNNPAIGAMQHVNGKSSKERIALTQEEERSFLEYISKGRYSAYKNMFLVLFHSGARSGEIRALTWRDIDFENEMIIIDKSVNYDKLEGRTKREYFITSPKTRSSIRKIPMLGQVKEALLEQKRL